MNRKGYMLVEIILASVIAFMLAWFIIELTIKLKNKNDDTLVETLVKTDQTIAMNEIMKLAKERKNTLCQEGKAWFSVEDDRALYYTYKVYDKNGEEIGEEKKQLVIFNQYINVNNENDITCDIRGNNVNVHININIPQLPDKDGDFDIDVTYEYGDIGGYFNPDGTLRMA